MMTWQCHDARPQEWLVCTSSETVHGGCPVLHTIPAAHSRQDALLVAVVRHACVAAQQGSIALPVSVEVLVHAAA
jgi:invasion protein IalB